MTKTEKQNVPKQRFPGFEGNWAHSRLGMLGTFKSGVGFSEVEQGGTNGVPFYKVSDMNLPGNEAVMTTANNYVTADQISRLKFKPIRERAVIFAKVGAAIFLERKRRAENFLLDNNMMAFIPRETIADEYLSHLFSNIRLSKFAQVGALPSYNSSDLATLKLHLPTLPEQRKIAGFLSAVDEKISQLSRKKALLEDYKKGCMQQLFSQKIRFKDDTGNDFPDWEEKRLEEVANIVGGGTPDSGQDEYWGGEIPWFTPTEMKSKYVTDSVRTISASGLKKSSAKLLPIGTILVSTRATVGDLSIAMKECCTNQGFQSLIVTDENYHEFWYYWLVSNKKELLRRASGSTFLEINKSEISKIPAKRPHPDEQRKIADFLSALDRKIDLVAQELTFARSFKAGLLQQMFV